MEVISQQVHTVTILEVSRLVESPFECTVLADAGVVLLLVVVSLLQCVLNGRLITALLASAQNDRSLSLKYARHHI